jgi:hypothetical protein
MNSSVSGVHDSARGWWLRRLTATLEASMLVSLTSTTPDGTDAMLDAIAAKPVESRVWIDRVTVDARYGVSGTLADRRYRCSGIDVDFAVGPPKRLLREPAAVSVSSC